MSLILLGLELYLAAVLGVSGLAKIQQPQQFAAVLRQQGILPPWSISVICTVLPWTELVIAELLVSGVAKTLTAIVVVALFVSFLGFKIILLRTRPKADCGCLGTVHTETVDSAGIVVSIFFVLFAALHAWIVFDTTPSNDFLRLISILMFNGVEIWLIWKMIMKQRRRKGILSVVQ